MTKANKLVAEYMGTYAGKKLIPLYKENPYGIWQVRGEDPNCDMAGSHIMPTLGFFEGHLQDVVAVGVTLDYFWQWGSGGDFTLINVKKVADQKKQMDLIERFKETSEFGAISNLYEKNVTGYWRIDSPGFGERFLKGKLRDVVKKAVTFPGFFGDFGKVSTITQIDVEEGFEV